jgi:hypothetical protein
LELSSPIIIIRRRRCGVHPHLAIVLPALHRVLPVAGLLGPRLGLRAVLLLAAELVRLRSQARSASLPAEVRPRKAPAVAALPAGVAAVVVVVVADAAKVHIRYPAIFL